MTGRMPVTGSSVSSASSRAAESCSCSANVAREKSGRWRAREATIDSASGIPPQCSMMA